MYSFLSLPTHPSLLPLQFPFVLPYFLLSLPVSIPRLVFTPTYALFILGELLSISFSNLLPVSYIYYTPCLFCGLTPTLSLYNIQTLLLTLLPHFLIPCPVLSLFFLHLFSFDFPHNTSANPLYSSPLFPYTSSRLFSPFFTPFSFAFLLIISVKQQEKA